MLTLKQLFYLFPLVWLIFGAMLIIYCGENKKSKIALFINKHLNELTFEIILFTPVIIEIIILYYHYINNLSF